MRTIKHILLVLVLLAPSSMAYAATLFLLPPQQTIAPGQPFSLDLKVDSAGAGFNAAQATIRFPKDLMRVSSVDKASSSLSFWLEDPVISNDQGVVSFIGGTPYGVSGSAIQILHLAFTPIGTGSGTISITDAAVTASDGSGTNILSTTSDATIRISPSETGAGGGAAGGGVASAQIGRAPTQAEGTPNRPAVHDPLYPDPTQWYSAISPFVVSWDLPADISGVSAVINKQPTFSPSASEGLFTSETFNALSDGVWYLHVRFKNNIGWGAATDQRIAVDTQPPLGFKITPKSGDTSDNPAPTLRFSTSDALSGLKEYQVRVDTADPVVISAQKFSGSYTLPLLPPGDHDVVIRAVDQASNSIEGSLVLHVLPIASPSITFVTDEIFSDDQRGLTVKGTALASSTVLLALKEGSAIVASASAVADADGNWGYTFDEVLHNGTYAVSAQSKDGRGALSLLVESTPISVSDRPIIQFGVLRLGMGGAALLLLCILIAGFAGGFVFYKKRREKLSQRLLVAETDVAKVFKLISEDVKNLRAGVPETEASTLIIERLQNNIKKMEGYLRKELENVDRT